MLKQHLATYIFGFKHEWFIFQYKTERYLSTLTLTSDFHIETSYLLPFFKKGQMFTYFVFINKKAYLY